MLFHMSKDKIFYIVALTLHLYYFTREMEPSALNPTPWVGNLSQSRAKNKLCKLWRAVLISTNNSLPFAVYDVVKIWGVMEF